VGINAADVAMPKATPHFDNFLSTRENQIWLTGKGRTVKSKAIAHLVQEATYSHLRLGVLAADLAHILAAPGSGQAVDHFENPETSIQLH
jgi:hypothetical protein